MANLELYVQGDIPSQLSKLTHYYNMSLEELYAEKASIQAFLDDHDSKNYDADLNDDIENLKWIEKAIEIKEEELAQVNSEEQGETQSSRKK